MISDTKRPNQTGLVSFLEVVMGEGDGHKSGSWALIQLRRSAEGKEEKRGETLPEGDSPISPPEHQLTVIRGELKKKEKKSLSFSEDVNIKAACWRDRAAVQSSHLILRLSDPVPAVIYYGQARRRVSGWIPSAPPPPPRWESSAV